MEELDGLEHHLHHERQMVLQHTQCLLRLPAHLAKISCQKTEGNGTQRIHLVLVRLDEPLGGVVHSDVTMAVPCCEAVHPGQLHHVGQAHNIQHFLASKLELVRV